MVSRVRVLVVDDSVVVRRLVSDVLTSDPGIEVVGTAANGLIALAKVDALRPDIVTMDIEMPELDGVEAVRRMRASGHRMPVIMFSTLTDRGATATLDALAAGATDYVTKPANVGSVGQSIDQVRSVLIPKVKALVTAAAPQRAPQSPGRAAGPPPSIVADPPLAARATPPSGYRALVVGASTGGPEALRAFLGELPPLPVPVAVVQHMPPVFTRQFAARLDRQLAAAVVEAEVGSRLLPGTVLVAPGDHHLHVGGSAAAPVVSLSQEAPENYCRPAVDVLFRSAAAVYGAHVLAVVLTGMGHDGCAGARAVVEAGGSVLVQDRESSVVWGMPGSVATAGLAEAVLPLADLAAAVSQRLVGSRVAVGAGGGVR